MPRLISREGAYAYLELTVASWHRRLIDGETLQQRLQSLADLIDGDDWYSSVDADAADGDNGELTLEVVATQEESHRYFAAHGEDGGTGRNAKSIVPDSSFTDAPGAPATLYLSTQWLSAGVSPGMRGWEFHKGDADPNPSVPHGHHVSVQGRKLDAYTGIVFDNARRTGRVGRRVIALLWSDDRFRQFAREVLMHFVNTNPHYQFRVAHPLRLPRKRK